jgi:hypothetical protein
MFTRIYGASDDLIEIDGQINDEIEAYSAERKPIEFKTSLGTKGTILYNGEWKITITEEGSDFVRVISSIGDEYDDKHTEENTNDIPSYSDVLILSGDLKWVKVKGEKFKS